jgi:hypothetical protein
MSSQAVLPNSESAILARLIQAHGHPLAPEVARYLLSFTFEAQDLERMNELAEANRNGELSPDERAELESYLHVSSLLAVMQSEARRFLTVASKEDHA